MHCKEMLHIADAGWSICQYMNKGSVAPPNNCCVYEDFMMLKQGTFVELPVNDFYDFHMQDL